MRSMKLVSALYLLLALPLVAVPAWAGGDTLDTLKENFSVTAGYADSNHQLGFTLNKTAPDPTAALVSSPKKPENLLERLGDIYTKMQNNGYDIKLGFGSGNQGPLGQAYGLDALDGEDGLDADPGTEIPYDLGHEDSAGPSFYLKFQFKF